MANNNYRRKVVILEFGENEEQLALDTHAQLSEKYKDPSNPDEGKLEASLLPYYFLAGRQWILVYVLLFVL